MARMNAFCNVYPRMLRRLPRIVPPACAHDPARCMLLQLVHVVLHSRTADADGFIVSKIGTAYSLPGSFNLGLCALKQSNSSASIPTYKGKQ